MTRKFYLFLVESVVLLFVFFTTTSPVFAQNKTDTNTNKLLKISHSISLTYKVIDADSSTFGYEIYSNGKLMIDQNSIPAMPGNTGFKTKAKAEKVAKLVINKIKVGEIPPTVQIEELRKLKVI